MRFSLLFIISIIAVAAGWLAAFSYPNNSKMDGYDLNLDRFEYLRPKVPIELSANNNDKTDYEAGWEDCLDHFIYPSMASWKHSEYRYQDKYSQAWCDGHKSCSDRIQKTLDTEPKQFSGLWTPRYYRAFWPSVITILVFTSLAGRRWITKR